MDFSHMPQKTSRIREPRILLTSRLATLIRPFVLVHMLVPFTGSSEDLAFVATSLVLANDVAIIVARWLTFRTRAVSLYCIARSWNVSMSCHLDAVICTRRVECERY